MNNSTPVMNLRKKTAGWKGLIVVLTAIVLTFSACILPDGGGSSLLERLHEFDQVSIDFNADIESNNDFISFSGLMIDNIPVDAGDFPLEWNDTQFSVNYDYNYETFGGERIRTYGHITGTLSADARTLESLTADQTSLYLDSGDVFKAFITVIDVPYDADYQYDSYSPRFSAEGQSVSNHVYSYSQSWEFINSEGQTVTVYATSVYYNNPDDVPFLHITFSD
jgi:hypothetical protein